ncbi:ubiquinol-cytochrome c reductase complex 14 kDa protein [Hyphopichia burtonii NRRL Y-1933]|uniref:Cytochrome b-c1 complex subunit 7 n=1 Tax=Hyphopichia burtonii NRRL Y-1933 TaxID=984485 RepID=A0A1E4RDD6_9ASCO|nr:ubiquinol-cytochrome c reductase complex 14 kDa protein [Hyphopichia burtonii NRRL Y-1933]ODV65243.1 ubiquinol-cytochrome c reductase complex 14 kDa protein [Hyphopichia burtonii NRRL Y-1933]
MASVTSIVKLSDFILSRPTLSKIVVPAAKAFCAYAGYREMGLKYNDLIADENPIVEKAISRLPEQEVYARNYRMITAHQLALSHQLLPPKKAVQPEEDTNYLIPYILEVEKEAFEKAELDNIQVSK